MEHRVPSFVDNGEVVRLSGDPNGLFDKVLDLVRKDRSKLEHVLQKHGDMRRDLEPGLKTALRVDSVEQPEMPPVSRQAYRAQAQTAGVNRAKQVRVEKPLPPWVADPRATLGGFLLTPSFQNLVNLLIIFLVVFVGVLGALFIAPQRRSVGKILGQMISMVPTRGDLIGGLLSTADPKKIGEAINGAINDNPQFLVDMIAVMPTDTLAYVATEVVTQYPEVLTAALDGLDPEALAGAINTPNTTKLAVDLMNAIDPSIISAVMNQATVDLLSDLLKYLDPEPIAYGVNNVGPWATELIGSLSPVVLADVINENGAFINELMGVMDMTAVAPVINNLLGDSGPISQFAGDLIGRLDANMIAAVINNNGDFIKKAAGSIDLAPLMPAINSNGPWIAKLMGRMDPGLIANLLNSNMNAEIDMINDVVAGMDMTPMSGLINDVLRDYGFTNKVLGAINPAAINQVIGNAGAFVSSLLATLDPSVINQVLAMVSGQSTFVAQVIGNVSPELAGAIVNNQAFISKVLSIMNPAVLADVVNQNAGKVNGLLAALNPQVLAKAVEDALPQMLPGILAHLDPGEVAGVVNDVIPGVEPLMPEMMDMVSEMLDKLDPSVIGDIFNEAGPFITGLLGKMDPKAIATIINSNGPFITETLSVVDPTFVANIINDNPDFLKKAMEEVDPQAIANLVNSMGPEVGEFIGEAAAYMSPQAMADIINSDPDFVSNLIGAVDPSFMSSVLDKSSAFINGLLPYIDEQLIAPVLNTQELWEPGGVMEGALLQMDPARIANAVNANPDLFVNVIGLVDAQQMGSMINAIFDHPVVGNVGERLLTVLANAPQATMQIIADIVNNNASMLSDIISGIDPSLIPIIADVINRPEVMGPGGIGLGLISNLDAAALGSLITANPAAIGQLLAGVDVSVLTSVVNANPTLLSKILAMMDPSCLTQLLPMGETSLTGSLTFEIKGRAQVLGMWFTLPLSLTLPVTGEIGIVLAPP